MCGFGRNDNDNDKSSSVFFLLSLNSKERNELEILEGIALGIKARRGEVRMRWSFRSVFILLNSERGKFACRKKNSFRFGLGVGKT